MQRGLLAVLVTVIVAGVAAVAAYMTGYDAGLVAGGSATVAPIVVTGGGPGFLGFLAFIFVLFLLFALFRAFARPRWAGTDGGPWGHGGRGRWRGPWGDAWDKGHWTSGEHPIPRGLDELHRRLHEDQATQEPIPGTDRARSEGRTLSGDSSSAG
jgi:hypothetical protein